jgi:hypothetical protein
LGIFNDPKRLAKLLGSVKVPGSKRPLRPVTVARLLQEGCDELGSKEEVMKRVDLATSMWSGFERIIAIDEDIENLICWGKSNPETLEIGFSVSHVLALFTPSEQQEIVNTMWNYGRSLTHDELRRIRTYYLSNSEQSVGDAMAHILKLDRPYKTIVSIFISGLKENIFENIKKSSLDKNISVNDLAKEIFSKHLDTTAVTGMNVKKNVIRISFSEHGKKEFIKFGKDNKINKNDIVNYIFKIEGFDI